MTNNVSPVSAEELKPCPMCGSNPILDGRSDDVRVRCESCGVQGSPAFFSSDDQIKGAESEAIAKWNRRSSASGANVPDGQLDLIEEVLTNGYWLGDRRFRDVWADCMRLAAPAPAVKEPSIDALTMKAAVNALQYYADGLTDDGSVARVAIHAITGGKPDGGA